MRKNRVFSRRGNVTFRKVSKILSETVAKKDIMLYNYAVAECR